MEKGHITLYIYAREENRQEAYKNSTVQLSPTGWLGESNKGERTPVLSPLL